MKNLAYSLFVSTVAFSSIFASYDPEIAFTEVETNYQKGNYKNFLDDVHTKYLQAKKEGKTQEFSQFVSDEEITPSDKQKLAKQAQTLDQERNAKLREIVAKNPNAPISKVISQVLSCDNCEGAEKEAWDYLNNLDKGLSKKTENTFDKSMQEIQDEYSVKKMMVQSSFYAGEITQDQSMQQQSILEEEKLQKMLEVCKKSDAPIAKKIVATSSTVFPKMIQTKMNTMYIFSLFQGQISPKDEVEQKVKDILVEYRNKKRDLLSHTTQ